MQDRTGACRYKKCVQVGMSPHRIIAQMRGEESCLPMVTLSSKDVDYSHMLQNLLYIEEKIKILKESDYFPYSLTRTIEDYMSQPSPLNHTDRYHIITDWTKPIKWIGFSKDVAYLPYKLWGYMEIILAIDFYKTFAIFHRLNFADKLHLLKGTLRQVRLFHSSYDSYLRGHKEIYAEPDGYIPFAHQYRYSTGVFRLECDSSFYKFHEATCVPACEKAKMTIEKAVLLKAIIAMNHDAPNLSRKARDLVAAERLKYVKALMEIVRLENPSDKWAAWFLRLYELVNRNMYATNFLANLFFSKVVPITCTSSNVQLERIWVQLLIQ
uniref:NR LBD domain-containing protein n=1 Tax=Steinernema glaseri TaxID=37863 RepID=A0A1I7XXH4_9BILA